MFGIIKLIDQRKSAHRNHRFGFLICVESAQRLFFHESDCLAEFAQLTPGQAVSFEPKDYRDNRTGAARRKAVKVTLANPEEILIALRPPQIDGQPVPSAVWAPPQSARAYQSVSSDEAIAKVLSSEQ